MRFITAASAVLATTLSLTAALPVSMITCLQNIKGNAYLITPQTANYTTASLGENYIFNYKPAAIFYPATQGDVENAVKCAATYKVTIAPRGGGHSFEGYSQGGKDGDLILDLAQFQQFHIDTTNSIVTVGAGFRLGPLYNALWKNGQYMIPAGTCPTVGVAGHALGGGLGMTARKNGLLADNIVTMSFVDATGTTRWVSKDQDADLFWALRGAGGGSYGVVTQFQIKIYKAPPKVTTMTLEFPLSKYTLLLASYASWGASVTTDLMAEMNMDSSSGGNIEIQIVYLGDKATANTAVASLLAKTGKPTSSDIQEGTWIDSVVRFAWMNNKDLSHPQPGDAKYAKGRSLLYKNPLSTKEGDIIKKYLSAPPKGATGAYIIIDLWGGKTHTPDIPNAISHRDIALGIEFVTEWGGYDAKPGKAPCGPCQTWSINFYNEMLAAYQGPVVAYQNYIDRDLPNYLDAYYGSNLPRLKAIKAAVDPTNLFTFPQAIPLP